MSIKNFFGWFVFLTLLGSLVGFGIIASNMSVPEQEPVVIHCKVHAMGKVYNDLELIEFYDGIAEVKTKNGKFMYFKNFDLIEQD